MRVPWNNPGDVNRALDAGALGIICPNIDTPDQCEHFVSACRYAPRGTRSVGPKRAVLYGGDDYLAKANETILTMAQVESAKALINVKAIAAVEELDVVFIGPTDLGLSLGRAPKADQTDPIVVQAIDDILGRGERRGQARGDLLQVGGLCQGDDRQGLRPSSSSPRTRRCSPPAPPSRPGSARAGISPPCVAGASYQAARIRLYLVTQQL